MDKSLLNPSMKAARASDGWLMKKSTTLAALKAYYEMSGHPIALYDALYVCLKHSASIEGTGKYCDGVPDWILKGCQSVIKERIEKGHTIGLGAPGNEKFKFTNSQKHLLRYLKVKEILNKKADGEKKMSLNKAYNIASNELSGTIATNVTWQAIGASYRKIRKEICLSPEHWNYYPLSADWKAKLHFT